MGRRSESTNAHLSIPGARPLLVRSPGSLTQGEQRGRVSGVLCAPLPLLTQEDLSPSAPEGLEELRVGLERSQHVDGIHVLKVSLHSQIHQ
eukprot:66941-Prorocentrum_minimum.AAC.1